jgi:hypothetical protein
VDGRGTQKGLADGKSALGYLHTSRGFWFCANFERGIMEIDLERLIAYLTLVCLTLVAEHFTFGQWLKDNELARRCIGIGTVLILVPLTIPYHLPTLAIISAGFTAGGLALAVISSQEERVSRQKRAQLLKGAIQQEVPDGSTADRRGS